MQVVSVSTCRLRFGVQLKSNPLQDFVSRIAVVEDRHNHASIGIPDEKTGVGLDLPDIRSGIGAGWIILQRKPTDRIGRIEHQGVTFRRQQSPFTTARCPAKQVFAGRVERARGHEEIAVQRTSLRICAGLRTHIALRDRRLGRSSQLHVGSRNPTGRSLGRSRCSAHRRQAQGIGSHQLQFPLPSMSANTHAMTGSSPWARCLALVTISTSG